MKLKPVRFSSVARQEAWAAADRCGEYSKEARERFVADLDKAIKLIHHYPHAWPMTFQHFRKCRLSRFPYQLIYLEGRTAMHVLAVMHFKQKPGYWKQREP